MRQSLPRVLAQVERALVVSLYEDRRLIHVNPAMERFIPGVHEEITMDEAFVAWEKIYGTSPKGRIQLDQLNAPLDTTAVWYDNLGGLWVIASRLPDMVSFPPCAILTIHSGERFHEANARRVHRPIAFSAALGLEIDEAARELEVGSQMIAQAHSRLRSLADTLVDHESRLYAVQVEEGD